MGTALPKISADYGLGFADKLVVDGRPLTVAYPGQIFWVDENASHTGRGTFKNPDTTIDAAYNRAVANRGDLVLVKPGHSETSAELGGIITMDKDYVGVVGLGRGSKQAEMKFGTVATPHIAISGDNNLLAGFRMEPTFDDIDGLVDINASGFCLANNFIHCAANMGTERLINVGSGYGELYILDNFVDFRLDDDGEHLMLHEGGAPTGIYIKGNVIMGFFSATGIDLTDASGFSNVLLMGNTIFNTDTDPGLCVSILATDVVMFVNENYCGGKANTVPVTDASASYFLNCQGSDAVAVGSLSMPAAGAWS